MLTILFLAVGVAAHPAVAQPVTAAGQRASPTYVGNTACASCHARQDEAWRGSHHDRAMEEANDTSVLGSFAETRFTHAGVTSRFFKRDGRHFVHTDGPDGKLANFEIKYAFGWYPLQQYLIELPGGRLQALGIAWDARSNAQGGQRWFHLYPDRRLKAGDPLHWTGIDQNWNYQCADCHSTNLRKNYDAATRTFKSTWSQIDVGCEACHGPGSGHVGWAGGSAEQRRADATRGLTIRLDERSGVNWTVTAATGNATRSKPRLSSNEVDTCARCHARRGQFSDAWHPGEPLGDAFRISTLAAGLYYADGQQREEVHDHGSFLQSKMHAHGVTCSDCHEPHSQKLRAPGNAVCATCHAPAVFDAASHHHHKSGSADAACVSCHMPTTTYMIVDPRHDHSIRIPRPDRTVALGVPNACGGCHAKDGAKWAADALARWFPERKPGSQAFAEALAAGNRGAPGAQAALVALAQDRTQPAIARASAIPRLARYPGAKTLPAIAKALEDDDPLVRAAAAQALRDADPAIRARLLPKLLSDPIRTVRMEAARGLVGPPEQRQGADADRARFERSLNEYLDALRFNADRPEAQSELGSYHVARGNTDAAVGYYREAIALDPNYVPAAVNLADLYRGLGREREAESVLATVIKANPDAAAPRHALGLSLVRQKRSNEALALLGEAARLAPDDSRYAYVHAVALHDAGRRQDAIKVLERALARAPYDREILFALAGYEREAGNIGKAAHRARLLVELEPDDPGVARFAKELGVGGASPQRP